MGEKILHIENSIGFKSNLPTICQRHPLLPLGLNETKCLCCIQLKDLISGKYVYYFCYYDFCFFVIIIKCYKTRAPHVLRARYNCIWETLQFVVACAVHDVCFTLIIHKLHKPQIIFYFIIQEYRKSPVDILTVG